MEFDFVALIQNMGFPIATAVALGWYVFKTQKETRADFLSRENRILAANERFAVALDKSADAIADAAKQNEIICNRIGSVEVKVDEINHKVDDLGK